MGSTNSPELILRKDNINHTSLVKKHSPLCIIFYDVLLKMFSVTRVAILL